MLEIERKLIKEKKKKIRRPVDLENNFYFRSFKKKLIIILHYAENAELLETHMLSFFSSLVYSFNYNFLF